VYHPGVADEPPFHNPFGSLAAWRGETPAAEADPLSPPARTARADWTPRRAVVRMERAGRGGKQVTVVEHLDVAEADRAAWLRDLKATLGCGGAVEGAALVVQGDQRQRVAAWLTGRGVRKGTVS